MLKRDKREYKKNNNTTLKRVMREYIKQQHNIKACYAGVYKTTTPR